MSLPGEGSGGNVFISGHSLTGQPFPDYLAQIATAAGQPFFWNMQHMGGSSLRSRYQTPEANPANGMPSLDRNGSLIDVQKELALPSTPGGQPYDILIITEQHRVLDSLVWQDTVPALRAFQDSYARGNPQGQTYFYTPWIGISDLNDPSDWIGYERAALPVWRCVIDKVNRDIAQTGRADRIDLIPISTSFAYLVERVWSKQAPAEFARAEPAARLRMLFTDDVHLTPLGSYYAAVVTYLWIYQGSADVIPLPAGLEEPTARAARDLAAEFVTSAKNAAAPDAEQCENPVPLSFIAHYLAYTERTYHRAEMGIVSSKLRQFRELVRFAWRFRNGLG